MDHPSPDPAAAGWLPLSGDGFATLIGPLWHRPGADGTPPRFAMLADARTRREQALADAERMLENARVEAARVGDAARAEAASSAARRERMALDRIGAAEKAAVTDVRLAAADIAARAAHEVIAQGLTPDADAGLIDRAIQGLPAALAGRRAA